MSPQTLRGCFLTFMPCPGIFRNGSNVGRFCLTVSGFCAICSACCVQVDWKLTRGKWRPKLLDYAKAHSEATVKAATSAAFDIISSTQSAQGDLKAAMASLTELKVGLPLLGVCCFHLHSLKESANCKPREGGHL